MLKKFLTHKLMLAGILSTFFCSALAQSNKELADSESPRSPVEYNAHLSSNNTNYLPKNEHGET